MYYVVKSSRGREMDDLELLRSLPVISEEKCFIPICERVYRLGGRSCIDFKMLFPGYVLINDTTRDEITEAQEFIDCLWKMTGRSFRRLIIRQLDDDDNRFLEQILDDNVMRISLLEMTDDEQVKSIIGPLSTCWRDIKEFDYKNRTAIVRKKLFGRVLQIHFGIWTFDDPKSVWLEEKLTAGDKYIMPEGVFMDNLGA